MRHGQVVTFEVEGRLAERLQQWAEGRGLWLRPTQQADACLNLLRKGGAAVVVLRVGKDLEEELILLERISSLFPDTACVVVGSGEHPALANLAWDLAAACVFLPMGGADEIEEVLATWLPGDRGQGAGIRDQESGVRGQIP